MDGWVKMTTTKKVWLATVFFIICLDVTICLTVPSWENQIPLYLLSFSFTLPAWLASKKVKELLINGEDMKSHQEELMKKFNRLEAETNRLNQLIEGIPASTFAFHVETQEWFVPKDTLGISSQGMVQLGEIIHNEDKQNFSNHKQSWLLGVPTSSKYRIVQANGEISWIEIRTSIDFKAENGKWIYGIVSDITNQKEKEEELKQMAFYDSLTNLPNRMMLKNHLSKGISRAKRKGHDITVMFLDLDGFKSINDTLGHDAGDALLKEVAHRLDQTVREEDFISRIGGDEFIVVVEETTVEEVKVIAQRILTSISEPYILSDEDVSVTPSIGIAVYPYDGLTIEQLIKSADKAMYFAKDQGKANFQIYTKELENYQPKESIFDKVLKIFQKQ